MIGLSDVTAKRLARSLGEFEQLNSRQFRPLQRSLSRFFEYARTRDFLLGVANTNFRFE